MSLEDIVNVTITAEAATLTKPGFGTALIAASKVPSGWGANLVRLFGDLSELTDLGFAVSDPAYKCAAAIVAQSPRPENFKIGHRSLAPSQSLHLKCLTAVAGKVYTVSAGKEGGATTEYSYTVPSSGSPTTTTVAAAIAALIDAHASIVATSAVDTITITPATAGDLVNLKKWTPTFEFQDATTDPGIATDLALFATDDADWYGLALDSNSEAEIDAAAAWVEANGKLFGANSGDTKIKDSGTTTDVASDLKAAAYDRTFLLFNGNEVLCYAAAAWLGVGFARDPGEITWAHKTLAGVSSDKLTTGERTAIENKNANHYTSIAGKNVTRYGRLASGSFIDIRHGLDWLKVEMEIQVFALISSKPKVPYTDKGVGQVEAVIRAVLKTGIRKNFLADDGSLYVTMPKVADVDPVSRANRLLPDIKFGNNLSGAIHKTKMVGTLTV